MAALAHPVPLELAIHDKLASIASPAGVRFKSMAFAEDYNSDSAVFLEYVIDPVDKPVEERALELAFFRRSVIRSIWDTGLSLFPYVRFVPGV